METILLKFKNCMISKVKIFANNFYQLFVYNCFCLDTYNVINIDDERGLDNVEWSEDGQLLAVSTSKGISLVMYLRPRNPETRGGRPRKFDP